jgi:hypothetical protein
MRKGVKKDENLDNNQTLLMGTFIAKFKYFPIKTEKRNGIAR